MTYCVGILLESGMVFASDSRTNAGVDHINTFRKMTTWERPGERVRALDKRVRYAPVQRVLRAELYDGNHAAIVMALV